MSFLGRCCIGVALAFVVTACAPGPQVTNAPPTAAADIRAGRNLAKNYCSQCHAIGRSDRSLHAAAPPFRDLSKRLPIDSLEGRFLEGISTSHPDMPNWWLDPTQDRQMLAYLKSVQPSAAR